MPEIKKKVKTYTVHYRCDKCKKGSMMPTGMQTDQNKLPIMLQHLCNDEKCGAMQFFAKRYPHLQYD